MLKKLTVLLLGIILAFGLCACGDSDDDDAAEESAGISNPVHECDAQGVLDATGIPLVAPEGATDVEYAYIDGVKDQDPIAQVEFELDDEDYCFRARSTAVTDIFASTDDQDGALAQDLAAALKDQANEAVNLTGMFEEWECTASTLINDRDAITAWNEGEAGFTAWIDVAPGVMFSLSMDDDATQPLLEDTAAKCFIELQGDAE